MLNYRRRGGKRKRERKRKEVEGEEECEVFLNLGSSQIIGELKSILKFVFSATSKCVLEVK